MRGESRRRGRGRGARVVAASRRRATLAPACTESERIAETAGAGRRAGPPVDGEVWGASPEKTSVRGAAGLETATTH